MFKFKFKLFFILLGLATFLSLPLGSYATSSSESTTQYVKSSSITADVKARLLADSDVKSLHITVKTVKGVVTLSGYVETQAQKDKASAIAKEVDGVVTVNNQLKIHKYRNT